MYIRFVIIDSDVAQLCAGAPEHGMGGYVECACNGGDHLSQQEAPLAQLDCLAGRPGKLNPAGIHRAQPVLT